MPAILLLGGGHAHLTAIARLARAVRDRASVSLVAPDEHLLYSGMMPGWIAGQYRFDECAIHLRPLCEASGVAWIEDEIVDIDFRARVAHGRAGRYDFDLLSVNVGSANDIGEVGPDAPVVLGAKPFAQFVSRWRELEDAASGLGAMRRAVVVGGGAAAVEIAFALRRAAPHARVALATSGSRLLHGMSAIASRLALGGLAQRGVDVRFGHRYLGAGSGAANFDGADPIEAELVVVATGARPPEWLAAAASRHGVSVASDGGLAIRSELGSTSHANVFAAGDCASFVDAAVPKSGVHALRQGAVLARNLERALARPGASAPDPAERFTPRRWTLALLNRCDGSAIGAWGPAGFAGQWVWRWKDRIDRRFMARFAPGLPAAEPPGQVE